MSNIPTRPLSAGVQITAARDGQNTAIVRNTTPKIYQWIGRGDITREMLQYAREHGWEYLFVCDRDGMGREWIGVTNDPQVHRELWVVNFYTYTHAEAEALLREWEQKGLI